MQITAIILSGGKSTRMGTDKALTQINGKTLVENAVEICKPLCTEIIISSNNKSHKISNYKIIPDEIENCGPLGGIYSCLKQSKTEWNFVISVDAASVNHEFVNFLISKINCFDAVVPINENKKEPLIALYHKNCITAIRERIELNDFKMQHLLNVINTKYISVEVWLKKYPYLLRNINRPEDLETVLKS